MLKIKGGNGNQSQLDRSLREGARGLPNPEFGTVARVLYAQAQLGDGRDDGLGPCGLTRAMNRAVVGAPLAERSTFQGQKGLGTGKVFGHEQN